MLWGDNNNKTAIVSWRIWRENRWKWIKTLLCFTKRWYFRPGSIPYTKFTNYIQYTTVTFALGINQVLMINWYGIVPSKSYKLYHIECASLIRMYFIEHIESHREFWWKRRLYKRAYTSMWYSQQLQEKNRAQGWRGQIYCKSCENHNGSNNWWIKKQTSKDYDSESKDH